MSETPNPIAEVRAALYQHIADSFPHAMTLGQQSATSALADFLADPRSDQAFILRGYAGTGKTSLVGALVKVMQALGRDTVLLAPTGRAAKVFSLNADKAAYTIHKVIYRQQTFAGEDSIFSRGWNKHRAALFIVDEASMIANRGGGSTRFGTGCLLDDLIHFVFSAPGCKLLLVGDTAQLPPVGEILSPALSREAIEGYGLTVREADLTEVVRQAERSAVLRDATLLRGLIEREDLCLPQVEYYPYTTQSVEGQEVKRVPGDELIEALISSYSQWGRADTIVVTRSNKRANIYNNGIRARILDFEDVLTRGDIIMAVKNNYHWVRPTPAEATEADDAAPASQPMDFIANGDIAEVVRFRNRHEQYGFTFADVTLRFVDYDDYEIEVRVLLDTLQSESPSLSTEEQNRLYESVLADYAHLTTKAARMKALREDPYYNALQIKYAYAVTCHKAQGGGWHEVFVDQGYLTEDMADLSYLRWLYTAFTRTSANLYLVNWPEQNTA